MESKMNEHNSVRILIAEDSRTQAEQLRYLLEQHGYQVNVTADGKQALKAAMAEKPALVISDIVMPEMDGYELCKAIKSDEALKDTPVILVTGLSDSQDVILGLECGADHFIRKPYDSDYLVSCIQYLLVNLELRKDQKMQLGVEIEFNGHKHFITAERQQILDLLISTYEQAVHVNKELIQRDKELMDGNKILNGLYRIADGLNRTDSESAVAETVLERALEMPGIQAGWIWLRDGQSGFRIAATCNLPLVLGEQSDFFNNQCECQRKLLDGELDCASNIIECKYLAKAMGETQGSHHHISIPVWSSEHNALGVMNLVGSEDGLLDETALKIMTGIGNQVAVALDRARLHEHLEQLVKERTAKLAAEVAERICIQEEQARLVTIIEATPDFISYSNAKNSYFVYINKAGRKMTGLSEDEDVTQLKVADILPERAIIEFNNEITPEAIRNGKWEGDFIGLNRNNGREFPVSMVLICHKTPDGEVEFFSTILRDITERKRAETDVKHANRALATLSEVNRTLVRADREDELLQAICQVIVKQHGYLLAWVGYVQHDAEKSIKIMASTDNDKGFMDTMCLTWAEKEHGIEPCGHAIRSGCTQLCQDIANEPQYIPLHDEATKSGYVSSIALPLLDGEGTVFGILSVYAGEVNAFTVREISLLEEMAGDLAFGVRSLRIRHERDISLVKNQEQLVQLQDNLKDTMRAISRIVEMRDPYTAGHQVRVAELAAAIATQMGLPDEQVHAIQLTGTVHDLGKIQIPAEILSKPGKITDIEFSLIKTHAQAGYDILKDIHFPWPIAQMVLQHHECMDGSGYPQGLKGNQIILGARILSVADVVEAMSSHRPYRAGLGLEAALQEISKHRDSKFDPQVVDACLALFHEQHYSFKN